ncbi:MAG: hypothetical protein RLZZ519_875, partial [Bacteroidota bacterium]
NGLESKGLIDDSSSSAIPYGILKPTMLTNLALYKHSWLLHQKYLIVDQSDFQSDPLVLTGSHNWSNNGNNKNDENTVIVHNLILANQYYQEFMGRWCEREGMTCTLSGTEEALQTELGVFPNPNNGNFTVRFEGTEATTGTIELYDLTGKLVYATSNAVQSGINQVAVTTTGLPRGMYALRMVSGEATWTSRVIVQ